MYLGHLQKTTLKEIINAGRMQVNGRDDAENEKHLTTLRRQGDTVELYTARDYHALRLQLFVNREYVIVGSCPVSVLICSKPSFQLPGGDVPILDDYWYRNTRSALGSGEPYFIEKSGWRHEWARKDHQSRLRSAVQWHRHTPRHGNGRAV